MGVDVKRRWTKASSDLAELSQLLPSLRKQPLVSEFPEGLTALATEVEA